MRAIANKIDYDYGADPAKALAVAFPVVDPQVEPLGSRVLVQYRVPKNISRGGIILPEDVRETEIWNTQVVKVIRLGPLSFCHRDTGKEWIEGKWVAVGDYVRVPKHGGDKWTMKVAPGAGWGADQDEVLFALWNDLDVLCKITGDPLAVKAYLD